jgi:hypothetical protein
LAVEIECKSLGLESGFIKQAVTETTISEFSLSESREAQSELQQSSNSWRPYPAI